MLVYALYVLWCLLPLFFLTMALWTKLEEISTKQVKSDGAGDFFRQGIFVLICVIISFGIDFTMLESLVAPFTDFVPIGFFRIALLPSVLYLAALVAGPSKAIRITKASRPTEKGRRR